MANKPVITGLFFAVFCSFYAFDSLAEKCHKLVISFFASGSTNRNPTNAKPNITMWYRPCGQNSESTYYFKGAENNLEIAEGSRIRIGPESTLTNWIDTIVKGDSTHILCQIALESAGGIRGINESYKRVLKSCDVVNN